MKRKLIPALCILTALLLLPGCSEASKSSESQIFAMDTVMSLTVYGPEANAALKAAAAKIYELDDRLSATKKDSEVSKLNASAGSYAAVSETLMEQLKTSLEVSKRSGGAYDISIRPLVSLWGFDTSSAHVPPASEIASAIKLVDYRKIELSGSAVRLGEGTQITLASIAKGYTSQTLINLFREMGVKSAVVSLGGNVQALGTKPDGSKWRVGIQDPKNPSGLVGILETADTAVVTSGGYQRYFDENGKRYHHILDPKTGYPAQSGLTSVTIVCPDGALADALSTALFVLGKDRAAEYWRTYGGFEAIFITDDGNAYATEGIKGAFSLRETSYRLGFISKSGAGQ